jgi:hypothetical protein
LVKTLWGGFVCVVTGGCAQSLASVDQALGHEHRNKSQQKHEHCACNGQHNGHERHNGFNNIGGRLLVSGVCGHEGGLSKVKNQLGAILAASAVVA